MSLPVTVPPIKVTRGGLAAKEVRRLTLQRRAVSAVPLPTSTTPRRRFAVLAAET